MRWQRFYFPRMIGDEKKIALTHAPLVNQLKNVFRFSKGEKIVLFDNSGYDFVAVIEGYDNQSVSFSIIETLKNDVKPSKDIYLFASLIKKDKFEWVAQKATELGISHIIPILSERSEKKDLNFERINKIIIESAEQSGRGTLPVLHEISDLEEALINHKNIFSVAWHFPGQKFVSQELEKVTGAYIGPEGGWSEKEIGLFEKYNVPVRSLGPQVLRSETAVVAVLSSLVFC